MSQVGKTSLRGVADGRITHAGTFNANPIGIAAAKATLSELTSRRNELYAGLRENGTRLIEGLRAILKALEQPVAAPRPAHVVRAPVHEAGSQRQSP